MDPLLVVALILFAVAVALWLLDPDASARPRRRVTLGPIEVAHVVRVELLVATDEASLDRLRWALIDVELGDRLTVVAIADGVAVATMTVVAIDETHAEIEALRALREVGLIVEHVGAAR